MLSADARSQVQALAIELLKKEDEATKAAAASKQGGQKEGEGKTSKDKEKTKDKKKSLTAMKKRRKLEQILQDANDQDEDGDDADETNAISKPEDKETKIPVPNADVVKVGKDKIAPTIVLPEDDEKVAPPSYAQSVPSDVDTLPKKSKKGKKTQNDNDAEDPSLIQNMLQEAIKKNEILLKDRQHFYDKIEVLQETIINHEETMKHMQRKVKVLMTEKEKQNTIQAEYFNSSKAAKKLMETLLKDRDVASKEMDKLMALYQRQMLNEEKEVKDQIDSLQKDIILQRQDREMMDILNAQLAAQDERKQVAEKRALPKPAPAAPKNANLPPYEVKDGDSDLEDEVDKFSEKLMMSKTATCPTTVLTAPTAASLHATFPLPVNNNSQVSFAPASLAPLQQKPQPTSLSVATAAPTVASKVTAPTPEASKAAGPESVDRAAVALPMMALISQSIKDELEAWKYIFATFKARKSSSSSNKMLNFIGDTKQHFLHLMDTWLALGHTLIQHAVTPDKLPSGELSCTNYTLPYDN